MDSQVASVSGHEPSGIDVLLSASLKAVGAAIAIYIAVSLIASIVWWVVGIAAVAATVWLAIVVVRTLRERW